MSAAAGTEWPPRPIRLFPAGTDQDIACCGLLLMLSAAMLLPGALTLPMELWDESRNANNALEMARGGGWMVTTFDGVPDHWNTKPPLLVWIAAGLMRLGIDSMTAIRLPSVVAAMGCVLTVYAACRIVLRDRLAGLIGGLALTGSVLFMGDHVGRTGDYDALLSFFVLGFVLCAGRYLDETSRRPGVWIAGAGVCLFLGLMTKGIAAGMAVPGVIAFAILRRRAVPALRDWRVWAAAAATIGASAGYLALREQADPGYVAALWANDVSGRLLAVSDSHEQGPFFYAALLGTAFQPGLLLLPMIFAVRRSRDPARSDLCLSALSAALSFLIVLSCARTKIYWYAAPMAPLLAIVAGAAASGFSRTRTIPVKPAVILRPVAFGLLLTFWFLNLKPFDETSPYAGDQVWYGVFLNKLRAETSVAGALILDEGAINDAGFAHYAPVAKFFAEDSARRGENLRYLPAGSEIAAGTSILTCDPRLRAWLSGQTFFLASFADPHCVFGRVASRPNQPPS